MTTSPVMFSPWITFAVFTTYKWYRVYNNFIHLTEASEEESEGPSHDQPKDLASFNKDAASSKDAKVANDQSFIKDAIFSSTDATFASSDAFHNGHEPDLPRSR
jgi:hypothetical protein